MFSINRRINIVLIICGSVLGVMDSNAATKTLPAASLFYPIIGKWHGQGEMTEPGKPAVILTMTLNCRKVSAGWGVACDMTARNKTLSISESDLMGVDPVTGIAHWYSVTNQGETHDHVAQWADANTMHAQYSWTQEGKQMEENIEFIFKKRAINFRSVVSRDGQTVGEFSGTVKR